MHKLIYMFNSFTCLQPTQYMMVGFVLLMLIMLLAAQGSINDDIIKRSDFPDEFLFGISTSAYQIEGANLEDGKSANNWDVFSLSPGNIKNGDNGFIADDHYHRYSEDIEIMQSLGVDAYRLSISWARILPSGRFGEPNPKGILFYNNILNDLILRGIIPFVTIYHFDIPQELEDRYGSWLSPLMQEDYVHFAETCFKNFGDRVKHWITINEPNLLAQMAYQKGKQPPARCSPPFGNCSAGNSDTEPLIVVHNMLLAHAKAVKLYRRDYQQKQGGLVGIAIDCTMYEPLTDNVLDQEAANRAMAFYNGWVLDPLVFGEYPSEMRKYLGNQLPRFSSSESNFMKDCIDFIGVNHYSTVYAKDCSNSSCSLTGNRAINGFVDITNRRDGIPVGDPKDIDAMQVVPRGMREVIDHLKKRYDNKPMFVTENGYFDLRAGTEIQKLREDNERIEFHKSYLSSLAQAISDGADVRGYFLWTLLDDFEWENGYYPASGLYCVDPETLDRIPKLSASWYKTFLNRQHIGKYVS